MAPAGHQGYPSATIGTPKGDRVDHNPQPDHTLQGGDTHLGSQSKDTLPRLYYSFVHFS